MANHDHSTRVFATNYSGCPACGTRQKGAHICRDGLPMGGASDSAKRRRWWSLPLRHGSSISTMRRWGMSWRAVLSCVVGCHLVWSDDPGMCGRCGASRTTPKTTVCCEDIESE